MKKPAKKTAPLKVRHRSETVDDYLAAVRSDILKHDEIHNFDVYP